MKDWAKREVELACKKRNPNRKEGEFDYGCACHESALKAFNSLLEDGHSRASIVFTKQILNRLIDGKPLTPIVDTDDIWNFIWDREDGGKTYQCNRMTSLFKYIYPDGTVKYHDNNRFICLDINDPDAPSWHNSFVRKIAEEHIGEIKMPYMPYDEPIDVFCEEFLFDPKNGDWDTLGIMYCYLPCEEDDELFSCKNIYRYFKESESENGFDEISEEEYMERKKMSENRKFRKKNYR